MTEGGKRGWIRRGGGGEKGLYRHTSKMADDDGGGSRETKGECCYAKTMVTIELTEDGKKMRAGGRKERGGEKKKQGITQSGSFCKCIGRWKKPGHSERERGHGRVSNDDDTAHSYKYV